MILDLLSAAIRQGAEQSAACEVLGLDPRTVQRWRKAGGAGEDQRKGPKRPPGNKLTAAEHGVVLKLLTSPEFRDLAPNQIVPRLADCGVYVASESTMYRILRNETMLKHRGRSRPATKRPPRLHRAVKPNQVWSWDITYLKSSVKGHFFYLYVALDVWSRKIVGWTIEESESSSHSSRFLRAACEREEIAEGDLVIHSDNGGPMKGATLLATLQVLGVAASFSRPSVSNDNPFSEALFRTMKFRPAFPDGPFESIDAARAWMTAFERWYNTEHRHSGIRFVTPQDRHSGREASLLERRVAVYERARRRRPDRWTASCRNWDPIREVFLNPAPAGSSAA